MEALKIKELGNIPEELIKDFDRVASGLIEHQDFSEEKVLGLFAQMLENPKKYAYSRNKVTNLAKKVFKLQKSGIEIELTEFGRSCLPIEQTMSLEEKPIGESMEFNLREDKLNYSIFGADYIEQGALNQMNTALSLPISIAGSLMPDAHQGYSLPIGGVLATEPDKIIPYAVGVDIACRMCLSVFDIPVDFFKKEPHLLKKASWKKQNLELAAK